MSVRFWAIGSASVRSHGATVAMSIGMSTMSPMSAARFRTSGARTGSRRRAMAAGRGSEAAVIVYRIRGSMTA